MIKQTIATVFIVNNLDTHYSFLENSASSMQNQIPNAWIHGPPTLVKLNLSRSHSKRNKNGSELPPSIETKLSLGPPIVYGKLAVFHK